MKKKFGVYLYLVKKNKHLGRKVIRYDKVFTADTINECSDYIINKCKGNKDIVESRFALDNNIVLYAKRSGVNEFGNEYSLTYNICNLLTNQII